MPAIIKPGAIRVLIVEDERRLRELLLEEIPEMGFPATGAASAEQALRIMESDPHEILLLDLQLPLMGGMEFFQRARECWPRTQVIILTGFGGLEAARQAIRLDVVDFLTKPCHLHELEMALERARRRICGQETPPVSVLDESLSETPAAASSTTLAEHERRLILDALERNNNNRSAAAAELGISRRMLHYRLAQYKAEGWV